jgi:hypothetical protein
MPRKEPDEPGYQDVFTDNEIPREPRIMKDGTSVRWPPDGPFKWPPNGVASIT